SGGNGERKPGRNQGALARAQGYLDVGPQVEAGGTGGGIGGQGKRIASIPDALDLNLHGHGASRMRWGGHACRVRHSLIKYTPTPAEGAEHGRHPRRAPRPRSTPLRREGPHRLQAPPPPPLPPL